MKCEHEKIYLVYSTKFGGEAKQLVGCTLSNTKAEELVKELNAEKKITGKHNDGSPIYEYGYWIQEQQLIS